MLNHYLYIWNESNLICQLYTAIKKIIGNPWNTLTVSRHQITTHRTCLTFQSPHSSAYWNTGKALHSQVFQLSQTELEHVRGSLVPEGETWRTPLYRNCEALSLDPSEFGIKIGFKGKDWAQKVQKLMLCKFPLGAWIRASHKIQLPLNLLLGSFLWISLPRIQRTVHSH